MLCGLQALAHVLKATLPHHTNPNSQANTSAHLSISNISTIESVPTVRHEKRGQAGIKPSTEVDQIQKGQQIRHHHSQDNPLVLCHAPDVPTLHSMPSPHQN
jgi:hypothetical protein